jgi:hypothetical protein
MRIGRAANDAHNHARWHFPGTIKRELATDKATATDNRH